MGLLCEYFAAASDEEAASAIEDGPDETRFDVFQTGGIDPVAMMATLEELLTGRAVDAVFSDPRSGYVVASEDDGLIAVTALTDSLAVALAAASPERLREVAARWAVTEEFWGEGDPDFLFSGLLNLATLARDALARGHRLFCWTCL